MKMYNLFHEKKNNWRSELLSIVHNFDLTLFNLQFLIVYHKAILADFLK